MGLREVITTLLDPDRTLPHTAQVHLERVAGVYPEVARARCTRCAWIRDHDDLTSARRSADHHERATTDTADVVPVESLHSVLRLLERALPHVPAEEFPALSEELAVARRFALDPTPDPDLTVSPRAGSARTTARTPPPATVASAGTPG